MSDDPRKIPTHTGIMRAQSRPRNRRVFRWTMLAVVLGGLALFPFLPQLLATAAITPENAQAIYVFPGQIPQRAKCAARLYAQGVAPRVIFSGGQISPKVAALGEPLTDAALNARVARSLGVPASAEIVLDVGTSTWEDARALDEWMHRSGSQTVVAITSATHSRRAWYSLQFALGPRADGVQLFRCGAAYGPLWWTQETSLTSITEETLKLILYTVRYFLPAALGLSSPNRTPKKA